MTKTTQQLEGPMSSPSARTEDMLAPAVVTGPLRAPPPHPVDDARVALAEFEIVRQLGQGGNASVHLALWRRTGAHVALKLIHGELVGDPKYATRFQREVRASTQLAHPNICRVLAWGEDDRKLFLALELIEGMSVRELVEQAGPLPPPVAALVVRQLLDALGAAHDRGILHRDVKPANAMITRAGTLKLVDFGIARGEGDARVTETGFLVGTPAYMSPEQAVGRDIDQRSDLYAVGVTLFELLTGRNPYCEHAPSQALLRIASEPFPALFDLDPTIPGVVEAALEGLVARDPHQRTATAADAVAVLAPYLALVDELHPTLLADFIARPAEVRAALRREQAELERARAERLLVAGDANLPAAALALYRAQRLTDDPEIAARFADVCARGKLAFGGLDDDAIVEARAAARTSANPAGLYKRLADLYRARGDIHHAVTWLRRYLRVRPNDSHAHLQLERLIVGTPAEPTTRLRTRDILAGVKTGGWAAIDVSRKEAALALLQPHVATQKTAAPVMTGPSLAPSLASSSPSSPSSSSQANGANGANGVNGHTEIVRRVGPDDARARIAAAARTSPRGTPTAGEGGFGEALAEAWAGFGRRGLAASVLLVVVGGVAWVAAGLFDGAVATSQRASADLTLATGALEERSAERRQQTLLDEARMHARAEDWDRVVVKASQLMTSPNVPAALALEALVLRARAHRALGSRSAALVDVNTFLARAPLSDARYDEVRELQRALLAEDR